MDCSCVCVCVYQWHILTLFNSVIRFADMTPEEFKAVYLPRDFEECPFAHATNRMAPLLSTDNLPESFDWCVSVSVPVKCLSL